MINWRKIFTLGFWEQLLIVIIYGDNHYPSVDLWHYWRSYVGEDNKTYFRNLSILKDYLKD